MHAETVTIAINARPEPLIGRDVPIREIPPPEQWGVRIDELAATRLAKRLSNHRFQPASYDYEGTPDVHGEQWGRFVILGVSVIWRLWPPHGERMWGAVVDGNVIEDASGVWTCFGREPRSLDLDFVAGGGLDVSFFDGVGHLQDVDVRLQRLREVARSLLDEHDGSALGLIERAGGEATALRDMIVDTIPGYRDRPVTALGVLPFDKLANLAVTMLASRLPVHGTDRFPVFPDYMLPRHLRHEGVLVYSPPLAATVDEGGLLEAESEPEMAIRWATIRSAELLRSALNDVGNPVSMPELDYWLWSEAVIGPRAAEMGPHHLCITEAY